MATRGIFGVGASLPDIRRRTRQGLIDEQTTRQETQLQSLLSGAGSPEERIGLQVGNAIGGGLAKGIFGDSMEEQLAARVEANPDVAAARDNLALAQQMQSLTQGENALDPGSPEFFAQAAQVASAAGRPDMALELGQQAVTARQLVDQKAVAEQQQQLQNFARLPVDAQLITIAEDPTVLTQVRPDLTPAQVQKAAAQVQAVVETRRAKNLAELNKIKPAKVTKATKTDVNQMGSLLDSSGLGPQAFTKWFGTVDDSKAFGKFAVKMADQVLAEQDQQAAQGTRLSRGQIIEDIRNDLQQAGAIETSEDGTITGLDATKMDQVLRDRLTGKPAETSTTPQKRAGVLKL